MPEAAACFQIRKISLVLLWGLFDPFSGLNHCLLLHESVWLVPGI
jgi:hypothetical protein